MSFDDYYFFVENNSFLEEESFKPVTETARYLC